MWYLQKGAGGREGHERGGVGDGRRPREQRSPRKPTSPPPHLHVLELLGGLVVGLLVEWVVDGGPRLGLEDTLCHL